MKQIPIKDILIITTIALCYFIYSTKATASKTFANRSFYIDYNQNTFIKDGMPFRYISGSIHPYRVPKELWKDRLNKMWAAGLNAVQIYIFWNQHEISPGEFDYKDQKDVFQFIQIAHDIGFVVILRPGPYVCAEIDYGGLPWFLLANGTDSILPRSNELNYMNAVKRFYENFFPQVVPYLYKNGGPIISIQIENEYGFFFTCDLQYKIELAKIFKELLGDDVVFFTTDPYTVLQCGKIPGIFTTVDFGANVDPIVQFNYQRRYNNNSGPYVNSEFYPGWLDFWGQPHQKKDTSEVLKYFIKMLDLNANVNFYMFHGGTNFGFTNGADPPFLVETTSYDYDAPLSEAGDITNKYMAIRNTIAKYLPLPPVPIPANSSKIAYGTVQMTYVKSLKDAILENKNITSLYPMSFEKLGQGYGFIMYQTKLDDVNVDGKVLSIPGIRDRGYVQIGDRSIGVLYRNNQTLLKVNLPNNDDNNLYIIVENMGRFNFGNDLFDAKGILSNVTLDGKILTNWTTYLTNDWIPQYQKILDETFTNKLSKSEKDSKIIDYKAPGVYIGSFKSNGTNFDTFLKMDKFTKGFALLQSYNKISNLGRYWPAMGPQVTLYVPGVFTSPSTELYNIIYLFEFEGSPCENKLECQVELIDYPIIDSLKDSTF